MITPESLKVSYAFPERCLRYRHHFIIAGCHLFPLLCLHLAARACCSQNILWKLFTGYWEDMRVKFLSMILFKSLFNSELTGADFFSHNFSTFCFNTSLKSPMPYVDWPSAHAFVQVSKNDSWCDSWGQQHCSCLLTDACHTSPREIYGVFRTPYNGLFHNALSSHNFCAW